MAVIVVPMIILGVIAVILAFIKWRNKKKKEVRRRQWAKPCLAVRAHTHTHTKTHTTHVRMHAHTHTLCVHVVHIHTELIFVSIYSRISAFGACSHAFGAC